MILRALDDLALRDGLADDPAWERRRVDLVAQIDATGRLVTLVDLKDADGRSPEKLVPRLPKRTVAVAPGFFFDNAKYTFGIGAGGETSDRTEQCREAFREVVDSVARETRDEGAVALSRFESSLDHAQVFALRPKAEWTGSENVAFSLASDAPALVHERDAVRAAWSAQQSAEVDPAGKLVRCLVTGELAVPARLHPPVKIRTANAQTSGTSLVSFNARAFESQGLSQGENAPVSEAASVRYVAAMNHLLRRGGDGRYESAVRLGEDAVVCLWTRERSSLAEDIASFLDPSAEDLKLLVESPLRGLEPGELDDGRFYAMTLGANASRLVVRDWFETSAGEMKRRVREWFEDLRLGSQTGPLPIWSILRALQSPAGDLSPGLATKLVNSALRGQSLPHEALAAALRRLRLPPDRNDTSGHEERRLLHARCALVKATLLRLPRGTHRTEVSVSLDETKSDVPYLLGRLFAVLERMQGEALGDVNASIRDRFFGAAAATPSLVFPRLLKLSVHHAAKAERAGWLEGVQGRIIASLPAERFPRVLSLEDQGLFAVGYYHQREKFWEKRAVAPAAPAVEPV